MSRAQKKQEILKALSEVVTDMSYAELAKLSTAQLLAVVEGIENNS